MADQGRAAGCRVVAATGPPLGFCACHCRRCSKIRPRSRHWFHRTARSARATSRPPPARGCGRRRGAAVEQHPTDAGEAARRDAQSALGREQRAVLARAPQAQVARRPLPKSTGQAGRTPWRSSFSGARRAPSSSTARATAASLQVGQLKQASSFIGSSTSRRIHRSKRSPVTLSTIDPMIGKLRLAYAK